MKYLILATFMSVSTLALGQSSGNLKYQGEGNSNYRQPAIINNAAEAEINDHEITITVSGLLNSKADTYVAFFHVMQVGETAEATEELLTARIKKFKNGLGRSGVDTAAVRTDMISFVPKYDFNVVNKLFSKTYNEVPDGFELQKNVIIRYEKPEALNAIVGAAAHAEIYDLVKVDYFLSDIKKQSDHLRMQCMQTLKDRIKSYELIGVKLDTMNKTFADDFSTTVPQNRYGQYQAVARPSIQAVKRAETGASIKFRSADLSPSRYYQAVSYEEYDVVINPVVDEPMVQLTYQIKMKFKLSPAKESEKRNNYFIVTPAGQLHKLDI